MYEQCLWSVNRCALCGLFVTAGDLLPSLRHSALGTVGAVAFA